MPASDAFRWPALARGAVAASAWLRGSANLSVLAAALVLVILYLVYLGETHFPLQVQMYFGWSVLGVLVLLHTARFLQHPVTRIFFILLAGFLTVRYLWWRTSETLLWTGPADFVGMALVYLAELYAIIIHLLGLFANLWPMEREEIGLPADTARLPTVDVFIPTYNESLDIVRVTAQAAVQIEYPKDKLRVHILDDGGTAQKRNHPEGGEAAWKRRYALMRLARDLGANYITRESNRNAKAGNINHALTKTHGDLVLILDCDHVPTRDILQHMAGYFVADELLFLVQSPHFFVNPAPVEKNLAGITRLPDEGDMFYGAIQPGLDTWNTSYFCGSAALLRRRCLEEVGGLSGETITEDIETAIGLHSRGYRSIYIRRPLICGLAPESYDEFAIQRTRWAQGCTQVLMINNPLLFKGLSSAQRLCYLNSTMFWLFGFPRLIYYLAPASFLIGGLFIYHVSFGQVMAYSLPYVLSSFVVTAFVYGRTRRPFFSEIYESVQAVFLIPAVWSVLRNPWKPSFKVTPKGQTVAAEALPPLAMVFLLAIGANAAALYAGILGWQAVPEQRDVIAVTIGWSLYNLYLGIMSMGAFWERRQVRKHHRIQIDAPGRIYFPRLGVEIPATLVDMSITGMGMQVTPNFEVKTREHIVIETQDGSGRAYRFEGTVLNVFSRGASKFCGVELRHGDADFPQAVSFLYGDSERWNRAWEARFNSRGTLRLVGALMRLGVRATVLSTMQLARDAAIGLARSPFSPLRGLVRVEGKGSVAK